jgi:DNA-binding transcriptional LysR family regulator
MSARGGCCARLGRGGPGAGGPCEGVQAAVDFAPPACNFVQVEWDELRHVLAIAREGTLSGAAARLGTSHTTVGRRLRAIERALGVRLFDQTPEGFVPTAAGQDIAEVAERVEGEVLALEGRVLGRDARLQGKLRVATMDILLRGYREAFASFLARYPSVELTVTSSDAEVSLTRREADVALRMTGSPPEHLVGRKVGRVEFAVFGSKALVERAGPGAGYDDYPWLHWDERLNMRWLDEWLARRAPKARVALRLDVSSLALREAIAAGFGVHFLAVFEGDSDPRLRRVGPVEPGFGRDLWLLTLPDLRGTSRVRAFLDHMEERAVGRRGVAELRSQRHQSRSRGRPREGARRAGGPAPRAPGRPRARRPPAGATGRRAAANCRAASRPRLGRAKFRGKLRVRWRRRQGGVTRASGGDARACAARDPVCSRRRLARGARRSPREESW